MNLFYSPIDQILHQLLNLSIWEKTCLNYCLKHKKLIVNTTSPGNCIKTWPTWSCLLLARSGHPLSKRHACVLLRVTIHAFRMPSLHFGCNWSGFPNQLIYVVHFTCADTTLSVSLINTDHMLINSELHLLDTDSITQGSDWIQQPAQVDKQTNFLISNKALFISIQKWRINTMSLEIFGCGLFRFILRQWERYLAWKQFTCLFYERCCFRIRFSFLVNIAL